MFVPCYLNLLFQITSQVQIRKIFTYTGCITIKRVNYVLFYKMEFFYLSFKDFHWIKRQCHRHLSASDSRTHINTIPACQRTESGMIPRNPRTPWRVSGTISPPHRMEVGAGWSSSAHWCVTSLWTALDTLSVSSFPSGLTISAKPPGRFHS